MNKTLKRHIPIADGIAKLFEPHVEVVIHDLKTDQIAYINGTLSGRQSGDPSLSEEGELKAFKSDSIGPYTKTNWDGRQLRSTSSVIRNEKGEAIGLLCINLDLSQLESAQLALNTLFASLSSAESDAKELFPTDWREAINATIATFMSNRKINIDNWKRTDKLDLIRELDEADYFSIRHAVNYVAKTINISRASVYNALREVRDHAA